MSEKLTAYGWSFVKEREYVWLPRAQALQDRADAQHEALLKQAEALEAAKLERDALRKELESALSLMREHGIGLNAGTLDDAIRQALQAVIVDRDNCVVLRSERDNMRTAIANHERAEEGYYEEINSLQQRAKKAERERDEWRDAAGRQTAQVVAMQMECDEARKRAEAAEQREARLQEIGDRLARTVLLDDGSDSSFVQAREVAQQWQALADVPAAPVAEPQPPKSAPAQPCCLCKGKGTNIAVDAIDLRTGEMKNPRTAVCMVCEGTGVEPPTETEDEPDPAPTALDPALREPLQKEAFLFQTDGITASWREVNYTETVDARIAALVAAYDALAERHAKAVRVAGAWRRTAQRVTEQLAGEPERTQEAIDRRINSMFGPVGSGSNEAEARDRLRLRGFAQAERRLTELEKQVADEPERTQAAVTAEAEAWRAMLADPAKARLASCHRGREVTLAVNQAVADKLRNVLQKYGNASTMAVHWHDIEKELAKLAPTTAQGQWADEESERKRVAQKLREIADCWSGEYLTGPVEVSEWIGRLRKEADELAPPPPNAQEQEVPRG